MTAPTVQKNVYLSNAHLAREVLTVYDAASDSYIPYVSGTATVRFSLSSTGATTIAGCGPFAMTETVPASSGIYYYVVPQNVVAFLATYVGQLVYQVVEGGAFGELKVIQPMLVTAPRPPEQ